MNEQETPHTEPTGEQLTELLARFYREVDQRAQTLIDMNGDRLHCQKGCYSCCVDDITVFQVEADHILKAHGELLETDTPHDTGACAFLDGEGACRIYENRPYVCRSQGLPLRWLDETPDGREVEMRDICPLNDIEQDLEILPSDQFWMIGPFEEVLANIQTYVGQGDLTRVKLRDLWDRTGS
ncbi:MAG: YkgJ family cysteine cluster protein [Phycisphaerae bacterium]|nr:YkgJ family cysteine cluster protein [Phycisphaerae bacterium]